jgi:hypothetical protein
MPCPPHSPWLDLPNDIWGWVQIMKLLIVQLPPFSRLTFLGPNILLRTLFSNTLSLYFSLSMRDQLSHPYKTNSRIMVFLSLYLWNIAQLSWMQISLHKQNFTNWRRVMNWIWLIFNRKVSMIPYELSAQKLAILTEVFLRPPGIWQDNTSNYAMTACFHILLNSFFINHPIIQHNRIWATDPFQGTTWVYVTYSLGSVPRLAYRGSEKGSLKLYF